MTFSIAICIASFFFLLALLRRDQVSLGLPLAYLFLLLLNHVPGAYAHEVSGGILDGTEATAIGIYFTAIGSVCFVAGVWLARSGAERTPMVCSESNQRFWVFCLLGGWLFTYGLSPLGDIPSLGAAVEKGGAVWMLGVMLGLRAALQRRDVKSAAIWTSALMVSPILMLLLGGFLSYGAAAVIIVGAIAAISTVRSSKVVIIAVVAAYVGLSVFVNYFQHRNEIRDAVWGGAPMMQRIDASLGIFRDFEWFDSSNPVHLTALHERLNQNYFAGLAGQRIEQGQVDYLYGRSVWEGILSLMPRALWPEKPVFGGSPKIVMEMTGLRLNEDTSWGVGNVMEFQINFGIPGLILGFLLLGWLLGTLDRKAAERERAGELGRVFFFFLPAAALIQPIGSIVELTGGAAAALVAAYGWSWGWERWSKRGVPSAKMPATRAQKGR
jgi:hypothetical protein